jgi:hypothetical protein
VSTPWHADASEISAFVGALFRYAEQDTFLSLRAFDQNRSGPAKLIRGIRINGSYAAIIRDATDAAEETAQFDEPAVFCPPIATFTNPARADTASLANGLTLSVDLDEADPEAGRAILERLLGPVTVMVRSGSDWIDRITGEIKPNIHLHWRLNEPTTAIEDHIRLRHARALAAMLTGADATAKPMVHPLRWPGSWNLKTIPRMATIAVLNENAEIDLGDALEALEAAVEANGMAAHAKMPGASAAPEARLSDVRSAMAAISNLGEGVSYRQWIVFGYAICRATGGAPEGFEIWDNWSRLSDKYGIKQNPEDTWLSICAGIRGPAPRHTAGAGTIFFWAMKAGWVRPFPFGANGHNHESWTEDTSDNPEQQRQEQSTPLPPIMDAPTFMATFVMPDYLVDGVIQRGRLHALTSPTGHGKTAVALFLACMMARGQSLGVIDVTQGDVLFLAGENPDDLCVRLHAACQAYAIDPVTLPIYVMAGNFPISPETAETLKRQIDATGRKFSLIIGDSLAAYFPGDDENHNVQMGGYARNWRVLTTCAGRPAVMALAHPIKAATRDNLLPRGGGAFLAEIDANLTLWADGDRETTSLHWQGKIRGADFQPITFGLVPVTINDKRDSKGRLLVSVIASLRTSEQADQSIRAAVTDENAVLEWLRRHPGISIKDIALNLGWAGMAGVPNKAKVHRLLKGLQDLKLAKFWRGKWIITDAGKAEIQRGES